MEIETYFSVCFPALVIFSLPHCTSYLQIGLMPEILSLPLPPSLVHVVFFPSPPNLVSPSLPFFPISLWIFYIPLKPSRFPGAENLIEPLQTTSSDLLIIHVHYVCVCGCSILSVWWTFLSEHCLAIHFSFRKKSIIILYIFAEVILPTLPVRMRCL